MSASASIKVVKTFSFRGSAKLWSNRYHFSNDQPADAAKWLAFSDAVVNAEKLCLSDQCQIVGTYGYAAGSDVPVYSKTYTTACSVAIGTGARQAGEVAGMIRYATAGRTTKNHPLYLFNYYHGAIANANSQPDVLYSAMLTAMQTYANAWVTGFTDGVLVHKRAGPQGDIATGALVTNVITHRDFPR